MFAERIGALAENLERKFETRFEVVARDPRVLAFLASSINFASFVRIETRKLEVDVASFRARAGRFVRQQTDLVGPP